LTHQGEKDDCIIQSKARPHESASDAKGHRDASQDNSGDNDGRKDLVIHHDRVVACVV